MTTTASWPEDGVVEVEFAVTEPVYPFVSIAQSQNCRLVLEKQLPRDDERHAEYFSVIGTDPHHVVEVVDDSEAFEARVLIDGSARSLVEIVAGDGCPARYLAKRRAIPTTVEGTAGGGKIVAEVLPEDDPGGVVDDFESDHAVELVAKRTREAPTPLLDERELKTEVLDRLTERQREVLRTAHDAGYYDRPRQHSGEEVAAELGISPTTFQEHLRAAERKLVSFLVEEDP